MRRLRPHLRWQQRDSMYPTPLQRPPPASWVMRSLRSQPALSRPCRDSGGAAKWAAAAGWAAAGTRPPQETAAIRARRDLPRSNRIRSWSSWRWPRRSPRRRPRRSPRAGGRRRLAWRATRDRAGRPSEERARPCKRAAGAASALPMRSTSTRCSLAMRGATPNRNERGCQRR